MAKKQEQKRPRRRCGGEGQAEERRRREAKALRKNLQKRKDQARQEAGAGDAGNSPRGPDHRRH
ncbi:MAG TPA: hypothetical protein QF509_02735 [Rhodospirillales bacterium]|nr:hypothetical protein [Rhodospirillales bacterium]